MKIKILVYTVCIFILILIQTTFLEQIRIYNVKPNLLITFIIAAALLSNNVEGAVIGFFIGLSQDMMSGKVLGFYSLLGLYLGISIGSVNKRLYRENFLVVIFFTFVSTIIYEMAVFLLTIFVKTRTDLIFALTRIVVPEAIYNSIVSVFIYAIVIKLNDRIEDTNRNMRKF